MEKYIPELEKLRSGDFSSRLEELCGYFLNKEQELEKRFRTIVNQIVVRHTDSEELKEAITKVAIERNCISSFRKLSVIVRWDGLFDEKQEPLSFSSLRYIGIENKTYIATKEESEELRLIEKEHREIDYACEKLVVSVDKIQDSSLAWDALVYVMNF